MAETLGEKLRAAREERGISISEVAEQTRIAPMYIECIEKDNYKPLPGGIFNKGFVKSYARFIGFDEQEALQDYGRIAAQLEGTEDDHLRAYRPEVLTDDRASQSTVSTVVFAGIILALMTGAVYLLVNYLMSQPAETPTTNTSSVNQNTTQPGQPTNGSPTSTAPTMQNLRIEFRTASEPISLSATSDGNNSVNTVTPGTPQVFEPKESLRLSYAKALAPSAQLFLNGKQITLPSQPADPKRIPIVIEINAANLTHIWNAGQISFGNPLSENTATPQVPAPANASTPRPATPTQNTRTTPAVANTVRPTPTPIIVGRPSNRATPRPSPN